MTSEVLPKSQVQGCSWCRMARCQSRWVDPVPLASKDPQRFSGGEILGALVKATPMLTPLMYPLRLRWLPYSQYRICRDPTESCLTAVLSGRGWASGYQPRPRLRRETGFTQAVSQAVHICAHQNHQISSTFMYVYIIHSYFS